MPKSPSSWLLALWLFASILHVSIAVYDLKRPMDWDELDAAARTASPESYVDDPNARYGNVGMINPFRSTRNHTLTNSITLLVARTIGMSDFKARLPAIFFTLLFCAVTGLILRKAASPMQAGVLLLHTVANGLMLWYSHSIRGYISMQFFSFLALSSLLLGLKRPPANQRWPLIGFALGMLFLVFCHPFGVIFFLLLTSSLGLWAYLHRKEEVFQNGKRFLYVCAATLPIPLVLLWGSFVHLQKVGALKSSVLPEFFPAVFYAFGIAHINVAVGAAGIAVALFLLFSLRAREVRMSFLTLFNCSVFLSISAVFILFRPEFFNGRFLLAFVLPFVWWCAESFETSKHRRVALSFLLILVVLCPVTQKKEVYMRQTEQMASFHSFALRVKEHVSGTSKICLSASGDDDQVRFLRDVYFYQQARNTECAARFHVHFPNSWKGRLPLSLPAQSQSREVMRDEEERILYAVSS